MSQNRQMSESMDLSVCISLVFQWILLGRVKTDDDGKLKFPEAPRCPGLYRFQLENSEVNRNCVYIGETEQLRNRFQHYRTPGSGQPTSKKLNKLLLKHLAKGEVVKVYIAAKEIKLTMADKSSEYTVDLANKYLRRLLENSALTKEEASGAALLNR